MLVSGRILHGFALHSLVGPFFVLVDGLLVEFEALLTFSIFLIGERLVNILGPV